MAIIRWAWDKAGKRYSVNLEPDLNINPVYPDCDMISSLVPWNLGTLAGELGCKMEFIDTYYMCAMRAGSQTALHFQRLAKHPFLRWFGDHILFLMQKTT